MSEQEKIGRCAVMVAKVMKEYAELGTEDCFTVNMHLKAAMEHIAGHFSMENQDKFAEWLQAQIS